MKASSRFLFPLYLLIAWAPLEGRAVSLVSWDFTGIPAAAAALENAAQPHPLLDSTLASAAAGLTSTPMDHKGLVYSTAVAPGGVGTSIAGELNIKNFDTGTLGINDNYVFFTLTANAGKTLTIDSIAIDLWRNGTGAPNGIAFDVSVDGGAFQPYGSLVVVNELGGGVYMPITFTQSITGATTVEIRFTPRNAGAGSTGNLHINRFSVEGTVVPGIPEAPFAITDIIVDSFNNTVRLSWNSEPGDAIRYSIFHTRDLVAPRGSWVEANDSIPSAGMETTYLLQGAELPQPLSGDLFFIVVRNQ